MTGQAGDGRCPVGYNAFTVVASLRILGGMSLWLVLALPCLSPAAHGADVLGQQAVLLLYAADRVQPRSSPGTAIR